MTTTLPETRPAAQAAARERAVRTFVQGLGLDVLVAVAAALLAWLPSADVTSSAAWLILGAALIKTVLQAAAAYVLRLKIRPTEETAAPTAQRVTREELGRVDVWLAIAIALGLLLAWLVVRILDLLAPTLGGRG